MMASMSALLHNIFPRVITYILSFAWSFEMRNVKSMIISCCWEKAGILDSHTLSLV